MAVKKAKKVRSKNTKKKSSSATTNENLKTASSTEIPPHYDTQNRTPSVNTDVEIAKGSLDDSFQTDSRPKGTA